MSSPPPEPEDGSMVGPARAQGPWTPTRPVVGAALAQGLRADSPSTTSTRVGSRLEEDVPRFSESSFGSGSPSSLDDSSSAHRAHPEEDRENAPHLVTDPPPPLVITNAHELQTFLFSKEQMGRPKNTRKAIDPKIAEWQKFCDHATFDPTIGTERYIPTKENTYFFMIYQALRSKRKQGGRRKRKRTGEEVEEEEADDSGHGFDGVDYDRIMSSFSAGQGDELLANVENPIGFKMFEHYKLALLHIHAQCVQARVCEDTLFEPFIWGRDHKTLGNIVKGRKQKIATALFHEKMGSDATPYTQIDLIPKIEESLWKMGSRFDRSQLAALRNRHAFLMTTAGVMRFEGLAKRNLSEIFCFTWKGERDPHELLITMFQLPDGKFAFAFCLSFC